MTRKIIFFIIAFYPFLAMASDHDIPLDHPVYSFIERISAMHHHFFSFTNQRPWAESDVADFLNSIADKDDLINMFSNEDKFFLEQFLAEFSNYEKYEQLLKTYLVINTIIQKLPDKLDKQLYKKRWDFYSYSDDSFNLSINPQIRFTPLFDKNRDWEHDRHFSSGYVVKGDFKEKFSFYWNLIDNTYSGSFPHNYGDHIKGSGYSFVTFNENSISWNENIFYISFNFNGIDIQAGRNFLQWGPGERDYIILSTNAPAFDQIKFKFQSKRIQYTTVIGSLVNINDTDFFMKSSPKIKKYLAAQRIDIVPWNWIEVGLNQMIVYGNRDMEFGYSIPFTFFKSSEHLYGDRDNGLLAIDLTIYPLKNVVVYGTWLIDDITSSKIGTDWYGNKFGFQYGIKYFDFLLRNNKMALEYIKLKPYIYTHRYGDYTEYTNFDSPLGSFLQPNSDMLYFSIDQSLTSDLRLISEYEYIRHGENTEINYGGDIDLPLQNGDPEYLDFLSGKKMISKRFFMTLKYNYFYRSDLFITFMNEKMTSYKSNNYIWAGLTFNFGYRPYKPIYRF